MRQRLLASALLGLLSQHVIAIEACLEKAQTQTEMDSCASDDFDKIDRELNAVYQQVLKRYQSDEVFAQKLKAAQRAWLAFRDAELEAHFPAADKRSNYGSVYPMCAAMRRKEITRKRVEELREWLNGTMEGNVCAGSVHINDPDSR